MSRRIPLAKSAPLYRAMSALQEQVVAAAAEAGLDPLLLELVKLRASQINGCAFCLDMHSRDALELGESARRIFVLDAWRETTMFTERERAALALTEAMTRMSELNDVPDDVYAEATEVFSEEEFLAVAWSVIAINSWNRMAITSHSPLPPV